MKKILLSIAFIGLLTTNSFAQRNHRNVIETGIKGGDNMSRLTGGNTQEFKPGRQIAGTDENHLSCYKKFAGIAALQYGVKGYRGAEYDQIGNQTDEVTEGLKLEDGTMHYLSHPITFKYYSSKNFSSGLRGPVGHKLHATGRYD